MGPGFQLALFAVIVSGFATMGAVFWLIGRRELRRQRETTRAHRRAAVADAIALFELAAVADAVALDARDLETGGIESSAAPGPRR